MPLHNWIMRRFYGLLTTGKLSSVSDPIFDFNIYIPNTYYKAHTTANCIGTFILFTHFLKAVTDSRIPALIVLPSFQMAKCPSGSLCAVQADGDDLVFAIPQPAAVLAQMVSFCALTVTNIYGAGRGRKWRQQNPG